MDQLGASLPTGLAALAVGSTSGNPLTALGAFAAGLVLPPTGMLIARAISAGIVERAHLVAAMRYGAPSVKLLHETFTAELELSVLTDDVSIFEEIVDRFGTLEHLGVPRREQMFASWSDYGIVDKPNKADIRAWCTRLEERDKISVWVPCIHPAIVSALLRMRWLLARQSNGLGTLELDYYSDRGIALLSRVSSTSLADFVAVADSPFCRWDQTSVGEQYRLVLPVSAALDFILGKKSRTGDPETFKIVLYQEGTSAQDIAQFAKMTGRAKEIHKLPFGGITADDRPIHLPPGVGLATIAPYWDRLTTEDGLGLTTVGNPLKTPTSLYVEAGWLKPSLESHRIAFVNLFIYCWKWVRLHPKEAMLQLLRDNDYMLTFAQLVRRK